MIQNFNKTLQYFVQFCSGSYFENTIILKWKTAFYFIFTSTSYVTYRMPCGGAQCLHMGIFKIINHKKTFYNMLIGYFSKKLYSWQDFLYVLTSRPVIYRECPRFPYGNIWDVINTKQISRYIIWTCWYTIIVTIKIPLTFLLYALLYSRVPTSPYGNISMSRKPRTLWCDVKIHKQYQNVANISELGWCRHGVVVMTTDNFTRQSLNSGSAQVQILLAACRRFAMMISDNGHGWK